MPQNKTAHKTPRLHAGRRRPIVRIGVAMTVMILFAAKTPMASGQDQKPKITDAVRAKLLKTFVSEFVEIAPGKGKFPQTFKMGSDKGGKSEQPVRAVTLKYRFSMAKYEVPQNLYEAVMDENPSVWGGPRNSVEMVTWQDANRFCIAATKLLRGVGLFKPTELIRLPSEAEWEYCCRAGTTTAYSFGDIATAGGDTGNKASRLDPYGWHTGNAAGNDPPVGALKPNAFGLYDMHGYLWEYVADAWHGDYQDAPFDGSARGKNKAFVQRVMRGGSWLERYELLRSSARWATADHARSPAIGFRCVKASANGRAAK